MTQPPTTFLWSDAGPDGVALSLPREWTGRETFVKAVVYDFPSWRRRLAMVLHILRTGRISVRFS